MSGTAVTLRRRSEELQRLDKAIKAYNLNKNPKTLGEIRSALALWRLVKGPQWESNDRNRSGIIKRLADEMAKTRVKLSGEEMLALRFVDTERRNKFRLLMQGRRIQYRNAATAAEIMKLAGEFRKTFKEGSDFAGKLGGAVPETASSIGNLFGVPNIGAATLKTGLQAVASEAGIAGAQSVVGAVVDVLPVLATVKGAAEVLIEWGKVCKQHYEKRQMGTHEFALLGGDAQFALAAIQRMMEADLRFQISTASITTAAFGANVAVSATGAGAAASTGVGAAKQAATLIQAIVRFAIEIQESRKMAAFLKNQDKLDLEAFQKVPMLGAYMLITADTSDLLSMLMSEFGQADWQSNVEILVKKHIQPAVDKAGEYVLRAPYTIPGVPLHRQMDLKAKEKIKKLAQAGFDLGKG